MADGTVRKHVVGAERWVWTPTFDVGGTDYSNLLTAYKAADADADGVKFISWDTTDATEYSAIVYGWEEEPYTDRAGAVRHKVTFTIEEHTA